MSKILIQYITKVEHDTETRRNVLISSWTKILGTGNGGKAPKKEVKKLDMSGEITEVEL